jgi:hypothetical protein
LGQKLSEELGEIAGWALSMDKVERDNILTQPITNPVLLSLKQEGAIIGDGVKSFVDRCFVPGDETHHGNDLHSWYQAYCKAHALSPLSYQKFIQRLQRVLPKHWRPSEVTWRDGKAKRQRAYWEGLRVLPCFVDLALNEDDDDKQPSRRPHIPNWICVKEECQDGGLTDLTTTLHTLTPGKNAETIDLHTLPTLPTQSLRNAKISDEMTKDCIEEKVVSGETESKVCKARLTPTSEPADDGCKVSKVCKEDDGTTPVQPQLDVEAEKPAEFVEQIRKAIANFDRSLAVEVTTALKDEIKLRKQVRAALTVEEFENFRLLVTAGFVKGTRVRYVGDPKYAEQFEGLELIVDSIDAHSQISCLKPDGYLTGKLKPEDLEAIS